MAEEAVRAVLQAEESARNIIKEAGNKARRIEEEKAEELLKEEKQLQNKYKEDLEAFKKHIAEDEENKVKPSMEKALKEAQAWTSLSDKDLKKAVDRVVEEVKKYGNS